MTTEFSLKKTQLNNLCHRVCKIGPLLQEYCENVLLIGVFATARKGFLPSFLIFSV